MILRRTAVIVSRPSSPPVFDLFQYVNTEGGNPRDFITCSEVRLTDLKGSV